MHVRNYENSVHSGIEELRDTLLFYVTNEARAVARERDMGRTLGLTSSEMAAMIEG